MSEDDKLYYESNNYLQHYGIKGMKWGVRRYQNYDGRYTQAGVKRYNKAMDTYEKRKADYKTAKSSGMRGDELKLKKAKVKESKRQVKKHYDHLKLDKKADQGKILYTKGYRIRDNVGTKLVKAGSAAATVTGMAYANKFINENQAIILGSLSSTAIASGAAIKFVNSNKNKKLRAYYAHTSKY